MSLRTIQRLAIAGVLTLGGLSAAGCDDEDSDGDGDEVPDAGGDGDGDGDGDVDSGPMALMCNEFGTETKIECANTQTELLLLQACCDTEAGGACGAQIPPIEGSPLGGCMAKGQPGNDSESCGA